MATGASEAELIAAVQQHARAAHDMDIPAELILDMARRPPERTALTADRAEQEIGGGTTE